MADEAVTPPVGTTCTQSGCQGDDRDGSCSTYPACASMGSCRPPRVVRPDVEGVCDTGHYRCRYLIWGQSGPPLVFVHGLSDIGRSFALVANRLADRFRCIAYDLPTGHDDGADLSRYRHQHLVQDLFALQDHLQLPQCYVLGSSFGSTVTLAALRAAPQRFPRALLVGGFACRPLARAELTAVRLLRHVRLPLGRVPGRRLITRLLDYATFAGRAPELWQLFHECTGSNPTRAVCHRALLLDAVDLRQELASIRQPVLLVCGDRDVVVGRTCEEALLTSLPNARRVVIEGGGHFPQYTHADVLADIIAWFLTPKQPLV